MKAFMLTTVDNPFDPFDDWENWIRFDRSHCYGCDCLLARIAKTSSSFSDEENEHEIELAIDEIIKNDLTFKFKKFEKNVEE